MQKKIYSGLDLLKFICSLLIIPLHINPLPRDSFSRFFSRAIGNLGVPCFFMIAGFLFFKSYFAETTVANRRIRLVKYIKRLTGLLLFWMIPYFVVIDVWWIFSGDILKNLLEYVKHIMFGGKGFFLWYIVSLAEGMVICYMLAEVKLEVAGEIALTLFLIGSMGTSYSYLFASTPIQTFKEFYETIFYTFRNGVFFAFPCVYAGMVMAKHEILKTSTCLIGVSIAFILFITEMFLLFLGNHDYGEMHVSTILLSLFLVMLFVNLSFKREYRTLRKMSFLNYVIHPMYITIIPSALHVMYGMDYYWYEWKFLQIPIILTTTLLTGYMFVKKSRTIPRLSKFL